jgi:hypothetical protein
MCRVDGTVCFWCRVEGLHDFARRVVRSWLET